MAQKIKATLVTQGDVSKAVVVRGKFNVSVVESDFAGTVDLERSFDSGSTWEIVSTYTTAISTIGEEYESQVQYRFKMSLLTTGGPVTVRLGVGAGY